MKKVNGKSPTPTSLRRSYVRSSLMKDYVPAVRSRSMIRNYREPPKKSVPKVQNRIRIEKFIKFLQHMELHRAFKNIKEREVDQIEEGKF